MNLLLLLACQDYNLEGTKNDPPGGDMDSGATTPGDSHTTPDEVCEASDVPVEEVGVEDTCDYEIGGFEPVVEWDVPGTYSNALPVVGDLNNDGLPEIVFNFLPFVVFSKGHLVVYHGDGTLFWEDTSADLGYGSAPAIADLDDDGSPEIIAVREYGSSLFGMGDYTIAAWSADGTMIWESPNYTDDEFDYTTGPSISDMDHDGSPEIIAGRVILNADGTERGVGAYGRGCPAPVPFGIPMYGEGAQPAVADLDLDGDEEVITGNAMYDADGNTVWYDFTASDGAVSVANLDDDPEGEFVTVTWNQIWARDTDGSILWGPLTNNSANIFPVPAIADVDNDGYPEIVVAGGNVLWTLNHDGSLLWDASVHDESGATGASMFDFDADGILEVVYIDEVQMLAFNGTDGVTKFRSTEHSSATMYDYPVIADVDADGHAEIIVMHDSWSSGASIYGDATDSWAPARQVWNQHAYTITNINDDLSVPTTATQNFTVYNSFHSALALPPGEGLADELQAEVVGICEDDCDDGVLRVVVRALNRGNRDIDAGIHLALYARTGSDDVLVGTGTTPSLTAAGFSSEAIEMEVDAAAVSGADSLYLKVDDDGTGTGWIAECMETNNDYLFDGPFCQ